MSDSVRPHGLQPTRFLCPWDSPGKNTGVGCHFLLQCMKVESESEVAQSCLTLSDPMDCSLPGSCIHGIFQARVLEWSATAFSEKADKGMEKNFLSLRSNRRKDKLNETLYWDCIQCNCFDQADVLTPYECRKHTIMAVTFSSLPYGHRNSKLQNELTF